MNIRKRYTVNRCNKEAGEKGLRVIIRTTTRKNPCGGYTTGYLITDQETIAFVGTVWTIFT